MATKLIRLQEGTLIEVDVPENQSQQIAGNFADSVNKTIEVIKPTLLKICHPLIDTWSELNKEMQIDQADVEMAFSFDMEGNLYITKTKAGANIKVRFVLKPPVNTQQKEK